MLRFFKFLFILCCLFSLTSSAGHDLDNLIEDALIEICEQPKNGAYIIGDKEDFIAIYISPYDDVLEFVDTFGSVGRTIKLAYLGLKDMVTCCVASGGAAYHSELRAIYDHKRNKGLSYTKPHKKDPHVLEGDVGVIKITHCDKSINIVIKAQPFEGVISCISYLPDDILINIMSFLYETLPLREYLYIKLVSKRFAALCRYRTTDLTLFKSDRLDFSHSTILELHPCISRLACKHVKPPVAAIRAPKLIRSIKISDVMLDSGFLTEVDGLENIEQFHCIIDAEAIMDWIQWFARLANLRDLEIRMDGELTIEHLKALSTLERLEYLSLIVKKVQDPIERFNAFASHGALKSLSIYSKEGYTDLAGLSDNPHIIDLKVNGHFGWRDDESRLPASTQKLKVISSQFSDMHWLWAHGNIEEIEFQICEFEDWPVLFACLQTLPKLVKIAFFKCRVPEDEDQFYLTKTQLEEKGCKVVVCNRRPI